MDDDATQANRGRHSRTALVRLGGPVAVVVIALALVAAACGGSAGPGVAGVGAATPSPGASSSGGSGSGSVLAFAACMRSHGVKDFPDPNAQGELQINSKGPDSDLNPDNPTFRAAQQACQSLMPKPSAAQQAQAQAQALKFSECMRTHGITDFPDPTLSNGHIGIAIRANGPASDLNPDNPQFEAAQKACQSLLPGRAGGGQKLSTGRSSSTSGSGSVVAGGGQ